MDDLLTPDVTHEPIPEAPKPDQDGKVSTSDLEKLLKRLADKDEFIERLKTENAGLRQEVGTSARLQEMLDKLVKSEPASKPDTPAPEEKGSISPDDIAKIVDETVTKRASEAQKSRNIETVTTAIKKAFGEDSSQKLKQRMADLNIGPEFLKSVASESPKAALELLGVKDEPAPRPSNDTDLPFAPPRSQVNPATFKPTSGEKLWKDYEAMRRSSDPKIRAQYWTPAVQNEIHRKNFEYAAKGLDFTKT